MSLQKSIQPISDLETLNRLLGDEGGDYLLDGNVPDNIVWLRFSGRFAGQEVVWNACIRTMKEYALHHQTTEDPKQYIDISYEKGVHWLEVGLNVDVIDKTTIEATIIMIRNYKRLNLGRHEYGARSKTL